MCECGCGGLAPIARYSDLKRGYVKGKPMRFIQQHHCRGKKLTPEHRAKIAAAGRNRKHSLETRSKISAIRTGVPRPEISGPNCWMWKGGITSANKTARQTLEQKQWIRAVLERDDFTCQNPGCDKRGVKLHAHHIKSFAEYPELRTVVENGITLCEPCHMDLTWRTK